MSPTDDGQPTATPEPGEGKPEPHTDAAGTSPAKQDHAAPTVGSLEKRRLPVSDAVHGTLGRFFPASLLSVGVVLFLMEGLDTFQLSGFLFAILLTAGILTTGYGLGLEGLRRWLSEDAGIDGRRSLLAGLLSPLAVFISGILSGGGETVAILSLAFLMGAAMAVAMFFPWLSRGTETEVDARTEDPEISSAG